MRFLPPLAFGAGASIASVSARTWEVDPDGSGDAPTIPAGIDSAAAGDTDLLASGVDEGPGNRDLTFRGTVITVSGVGPPELRVIDCSDESGGFRRGFQFNTGEGPGSILSGVTIRNGSVPESGGGILCANHSPPTLVGVILLRNHADVWGGGLASFFSSPDHIHCTFQENSSEIGGGVNFRRSSAKLTLVRFVENRAGQADFNEGGGLASDSCTVEMDRVSFIGCTGWMCGGAALYLTCARLTGCVFEGTAATYCGGLLAYPLTSLYPDCWVTLDDCSFTRNEAVLLGGGALFFGDLRDTPRQCSIVEKEANYGGALYPTSPVVFDGCLFERNEARQKGGVARSEGNVTSFQNCVFAHNGAADSLFCDTAPGDFSHDLASPCLDAPGCGLVGALGPGCDEATGVVASGGPRPRSSLLVWSSPSPFNASTEIRFWLPVESDFLVSIHAIGGRGVAVVAEGHEKAGVLARSWDGTDDDGRPLPSGIYFLRLRAGGESAVAKAILIR